MSDTETTAATTEPADSEDQDAADEPTPPEAPETLEAALQPGTGEPSGREAAKYRRKLRETESERDRIAERLTTFQRAEVERLAAAHLADPADLWRDGLALEALLDENGNLDPAKVADAAKATTRQHPHWRRPSAPQKAPVPGAGGLKSGATGQGTYRPGPGFTEAFMPAHKRRDWK